MPPIPLTTSVTHSTALLRAPSTVKLMLGRWMIVRSDLLLLMALWMMSMALEDFKRLVRAWMKESFVKQKIFMMNLVKIKGEK